MPTEQARRRLDREAVLSAAETIVDRNGAEALSMTALATELGVKVSSLYNHVSSLEALRGELQNRAMSEMGILLGNEAMGKTGERGIRALARVMRNFGRTHPGRYELAMTRTHDQPGFAEASVHAQAALTAIIGSYGIDDASLEFLVSAFAALHGVVALENAGFLDGVVDADRVFEVVLGMVVALLQTAAPPEKQAV